ncbi:MAG: ribosome silencing factor [Bacteroidetes bacterium]|jgi:ribosome-associated protein|nr:ribosome silencing factor [Bacteroidota bacterium]
MAKKKKELSEAQILVDVVIKGLQEKKAENIVTIDLRSLENAVCDFFVICTGTSSTHVGALSKAAEEEVRKTLGEKPWHAEGFGNAEWILLDYVNTVVHIFQDEARNFYNIEGLWADAVVTEIKES